MDNITTPYRIYLAAALLSFYNVYQFSFLNVISQNLIIDLSISHFQLGLLSGVFFIASATFLLPCGYWLDHYSSRLLGLTAMITTIIATIIMILSTQFYICILSRLLLGFSCATSVLLCVRTASSCFSQDRGFAVGLILAIATLGGISANLSGPYLTSLFGWRNAMVISVGIGGLFLLYMYCFFKNIPLQMTGTISNKTNIFKLLYSRIPFLGLYIGLMSIPIYILTALWGNLFLMHVYRLNLPESGSICAILLLGIIVGTPCIGWLSDKLSKPFLLMIVGALFSSIFALIFYTDDQLSILQLSVLAFSLGFMTGSDGLVFSVISIEYRFMMSTATAIVAIFKDMVGMISQPLFGWIFEHSKSLLGIVTVANQMKAAFGIIPIACLFSVIIAFFSRPQKRVVHHTGAGRHVHEI